MASTAIALDYYNRRVTVPIGKDLPTDVDLNDEVEVIIKGKVKRLEAAEPPGESYKGSSGRPAEMSLEITSVTLEGKTNTFTKMARNMDMAEDD
jgi:hypothetical protein